MPKLPSGRGLSGALLSSLVLACQSSGNTTPDDASAPQATDSGAPVTQSFALNITNVVTTFVTRDHFMAAVEMQLSGEPFAESMGRDLSGYSRDYLTPDMYFDPALNGGV